jgi:hypothetical protein
MSSCCSSSVLFAKRCSEFVPLVFAVDRLGSIDTEENGVFAEEVPHPCGVAGLAADIMFDEERFDGADANDCVRCAKARDGKPASKTTNGKNRPQKRDIGTTAKRVAATVGCRALLRNTVQFVGGEGY